MAGAIAKARAQVREATNNEPYVSAAEQDVGMY